MKTKKQIIIISLFFAGLFLFGSCYTKKRGVVPCPTWGQTDNFDSRNTLGCSSEYQHANNDAVTEHGF